LTSSDANHDRLRVKLQEGVQELGLQVSGPQYDSLIQFLKLLQKWNRVYNLTAVRSIDEMVGRHILDSLSVLQWLPAVDTAKDGNQTDANADVLDVGTGAGLPVIPLAIVRPDLFFLSVESNGKKTRFQHQALQELALTNIRIIEARIEDTDVRANTVIARAFTAPEKFIQLVTKNCQSHSRIIIMLGTKERMPETLPAGFSLLELQKIDVPQFDSIRHVAVCQRS